MSIIDQSCGIDNVSILPASTDDARANEIAAAFRPLGTIQVNRPFPTVKGMLVTEFVDELMSDSRESADFRQRCEETLADGFTASLIYAHHKKDNAKLLSLAQSLASQLEALAMEELERIEREQYDAGRERQDRIEAEREDAWDRRRDDR